MTDSKRNYYEEKYGCDLTYYGNEEIIWKILSKLEQLRKNIKLTTIIDEEQREYLKTYRKQIDVCVEKGKEIFSTPFRNRIHAIRNFFNELSDLVVFGELYDVSPSTYDL